MFMMCNVHDMITADHHPDHRYGHCTLVLYVLRSCSALWLLYARRALPVRH